MTNIKNKSYKLILAIFLAATLLLCLSINSYAASFVEINEEKTMSIREQQWSVLNVPVKTSNIIFFANTHRQPGFNHLSLDCICPPDAKTAEEFAIMENVAKSLLGIPYTPGGKYPGEGFDCSGFALYVMRRCGSQMTAASCQEQFANSYEIPAGYQQPGDLVFFTGTGSNPDSPVLSHVGIYLGDDLMIHAGTAGICIVNLNDTYWVQHFACFGRPVL